MIFTYHIFTLIWTEMPNGPSELHRRSWAPRTRSTSPALRASQQEVHWRNRFGLRDIHERSANGLVFVSVKILFSKTVDFVVSDIRCKSSLCICSFGRRLLSTHKNDVSNSLALLQHTTPGLKECNFSMDRWPT